MNQDLSYEFSQVIPQVTASGLFVSLCTILGPPAAQGPTGNPSGSWTAVAGLSDIPCMMAPPSTIRIMANEARSLAEIIAAGFRHVLLNAYYADAPNWSGKAYRAQVDGVTYDLCGAEVDSQSQMTRLDLKLVTL